MASQTTHATGAPAAPHAQKSLDPAEVRNVVNAQPTVAASVAALLTAVSGVIQRALDSADPAMLKHFADAINADPKAWVDAVQANTPSAVLTATPFLAVPSDLQDVFTAHAAQAPAPAHQGAQPAHR